MDVNDHLPAGLEIQGMHNGMCQIHGAFSAPIILGRIPECTECVRIRLKNEEINHAKSVYDSILNETHLARLAKAGVPERYRGKGFENWIPESPEQEKALNDIRNYAMNFELARKRGTSLIFSGLNGTGKSHLAVAVVEEVLKKGYSALYISSLAALRMVMDCYNSNSKITQGEAFSVLTSPDLLVLDDCGTANDSDTTIQITYEIIYRRYEDNKPTIITTNDTLEELNKLMGVRTIDRLRENNGKLIQFNWPSKRKSV